MAALATSPFVSITSPKLHLSCRPLKLADQGMLCFAPMQLSKARTSARNTSIVVRATYSGDAGKPSGGSIFVGGFILGGLVVGALACVYAPQISKTLAGTDRKDLMRKLPKFIYDEEKALEKTRKILAQKIEQLNEAIDDVSSQLRTDHGPNGVATASDEVEAAI
ncbi:hypothetical protein Sjap_009689 [Stephania japonica]|uniref:Inner membrane localized protein n=1 Tax=Stephania japonica TaxID=461633 RepID=A0AAP0P2Z2_9MAGN